MTIQIRMIMIDPENPTWIETGELAKILAFLDKEDLDYDLNPPIKRETSH